MLFIILLRLLWIECVIRSVNESFYVSSSSLELANVASEIETALLSSNTIWHLPDAMGIPIWGFVELWS